MLSKTFRGLRRFSGSTRTPKNSELRTTDDSCGPRGSILTIAFELDGQRFTAIDIAELERAAQS